MSTPFDLTDFVDRLLLEAANRQTGNKIVKFDFMQLCREVEPSIGDAFVGSARTLIQNRGFGKFTPNNAMLEFKISSAGLAEADRIRVELGTYVLPVPPIPSFWRREINWTKWGAIAAISAIPTMILIWKFS